MNSRRIPFQFSTTDPLKRQLELQKRFGLLNNNKMFVDLENPVPMQTSYGDANSVTSSPRLQHRVPIFVEGSTQPSKPSVDSCSSKVDNGRKPRVRVIPIEVEGANKPSIQRYRTMSGPGGIANNDHPQSDRINLVKSMSPTKRSLQDLSLPRKSPNGPSIYNIPIEVEGRDNISVKKHSVPQQEQSAEVLRICNGSNSDMKPDIPNSELKEPDVNVSLKKIDNILEELISYQKGVEEFVGTDRDKNYRYLDEMLTRCMLNLDNIDTMGNEKVRLSRKAAVRKVQACIDLLESKVNVIDTPKEVCVSTDPKKEVVEHLETGSGSERNEQGVSTVSKVVKEVTAESDVEMKENDNCADSALNVNDRPEEVCISTNPKEEDKVVEHLETDSSSEMMEQGVNTISEVKEMTAGSDVEMKENDNCSDTACIPEVEMSEKTSDGVSENNHSNCDEIETAELQYENCDENKLRISGPEANCQVAQSGSVINTNSELCRTEGVDEVSNTTEVDKNYSEQQSVSKTSNSVIDEMSVVESEDSSFEPNCPEGDECINNNCNISVKNTSAVNSSVCLNSSNANDLV